MIRLLHIYLLLMCSRLLYGQATYTPVFIDECTDKVVDVYWHLKDAENIYYPDNVRFKSTIVPAAGTYFLFSDFRDDEDPTEVLISNSESKIDTFRLSSLRFNQYVGGSDYTECDSLANGHLKAYYPNGVIRLVGTFKDGQVLDSLHEFYQNGQLREVFIPHVKGWRRTRFYKNGKLQSFYNVAKREEKEYYPSGILKKDNSWSSKYRYKYRHFDEKGNLVKYETHKLRNIFTSEGTLVSSIKRKRILTFNKDARANNDRFYRYKWKHLDASEGIKRKLIFQNNGFSWSAFPDSVSQIDDYLFEKIVFYKKGQEFKKIDVVYIKDNQNWAYKLIVSVKNNNKWIEEKRINANKVHDIIASLSQ